MIHIYSTKDTEGTKKNLRINSPVFKGLLHTHKVRPYSIQPRALKNTFIEDTRNTAHRTVMPQPPSEQAPQDLTQLSQSTSAASCFPESRQSSEISSLSRLF